MAVEAMSVDKENVENRYASATTTMDKTTIKSNDQQQTHVFSPELLKMYYARLFPYSLLYSWLSYDPLNKQPQVFSRREFSFTIEPIPGEEIYIRYQSFSTQQQLQEAIVKRQPRKIDIGAVFSAPPKDKNAVNNFAPCQRELVFDIDLTDYDEVRHCGCSGAKICPKCWEFMTMAVKVMDEGLREDFGFERIAWFYSGRRGVHAWVCDESARMLTNEARAAVANYFEVSLSDNKTKEGGLPSPLHPMLERAYAILEPMFVDSVLPESGHGLLASSDRWEPLLDSLPDAAKKLVGENLKQKWSGIKGCQTSPAEKWEELLEHLNVCFGTKSSTDTKVKVKRTKNVSESDREQIENWPVQVVLEHTYPRLDINVSKMQNHLLKSPFCVHPKTGRVCVPISVEKIDEFDPFAVPTLAALMKELDEAGSTPSSADKNKDDKSKESWHKTSLKAYFEPFQKDFLEPLLTDLRRQARDKAEEQAAVIGDF